MQYCHSKKNLDKFTAGISIRNFTNQLTNNIEKYSGINEYKIKWRKKISIIEINEIMMKLKILMYIPIKRKDKILNYVCKLMENVKKRINE